MPEIYLVLQHIRTENTITVCATVDGHQVVIDENVIRRALRLDDAGGIREFSPKYVIKGFRRMGYQGDFKSN